VVQNVAPKTDFHGNYLDIESNSRLYVSFKMLGEEFFITSPKYADVENELDPS
jgi:hypothetical protein